MPDIDDGVVPVVRVPRDRMIVPLYVVCGAIVGAVTAGSYVGIFGNPVSVVVYGFIGAILGGAFGKIIVSVLDPDATTAGRAVLVLSQPDIGRYSRN